MGHLSVILALTDAGCALSAGTAEVKPQKSTQQPTQTQPRTRLDTARKRPKAKARSPRPKQRKRASKSKQRVRNAKGRRKKLIRSLKRFQDQSPVSLGIKDRADLSPGRAALWDQLLEDCGRWASLARDPRDAKLASNLAHWMEDQLALERRQYRLPPTLELRITEQIRFANSRSGSNTPVLITSRNFTPKWPVKDIVISSFFGERSDPMTGKKKRHNGVDFAVVIGTDVQAVAPGTVTQSERRGSYGHLVVIRHRGGWESRYAHLDKRAVKMGQKVSAGQVIAQSGNSGRSTGPHLHLELRKSGKAVDPLSIAGWH